MPVRMIRLILSKLGRDRNASISAQVLPFGSPPERSAGGAAESPTTTTIPLYGEYGRIFAGVEGQDIVIETAAGGRVTRTTTGNCSTLTPRLLNRHVSSTSNSHEPGTTRSSSLTPVAKGSSRCCQNSVMS